MRALVLAGLLVAAMPCSAQSARALPLVTGAQLVKLLGNVDARSVNWASDSPFTSRAAAAEYLDMANGEFVHGYIQAVHDATEGTAWCWSERYRPLPHELEADARQALQRMSAAELKRSAAQLIVQVWQSRWPCPSNGRSK